VQPDIVPSRLMLEDTIERYQGADAEKATRNPMLKKLSESLDADSYWQVDGPAETTDKFAKKVPCHEIVIGNRGRRRLRRRLLDPVATTVAQKADSPVALVK
jgi:nucleotide-binding universal stress UspA family protein